MQKKYKGVKTLEVLEGADNYNKWIASRLSPHIKSPALEIGAGIGNISEYFVVRKSLVLSDNDPELVKILQKKFENRKNIKVEVFDVVSRLGEIKNRFKTIYAVNVLEHINDDDLALRNAYKLLMPGGKIVLLVPAKRFAYTKLDKSLGHYRRYEKHELQKKLMKANFEIHSIEYFNVLGLVSWLVRNRLSREHGDLKKSHVKFFDYLVPLLKVIEPSKNLPFGISLVAVAIKK